MGKYQTEEERKEARRKNMINNNIIGNNYKREQIYDGVYRYIAEDGYYFESYGVNYGNIVYGGEELTNHYILRKYKDISSDSK